MANAQAAKKQCPIKTELKGYEIHLAAKHLLSPDYKKNYIDKLDLELMDE